MRHRKTNLDFLNILFDLIDSSIDVHDLPNVLEARKLRKLVPSCWIRVPTRLEDDQTFQVVQSGSSTARLAQKPDSGLEIEPYYRVNG